MPKVKKQIIEPIDASFCDVASKLANTKINPNNSDPTLIPKALHIGILPIGDVELDCAVLDNGNRILTASSVFKAFKRPRKGANSRLEINGIQIPPFLATKNLETYINQDVIKLIIQVEYQDGKSKKKGIYRNYIAEHV